MTIFLVRTYVVNPDKLKEHDAWGKKLVALMKKRPDLFKEVKSLRVLNQKYGDAENWSTEKMKLILSQTE